MGEIRAKLKQAPVELKSGLMKRVLEHAMQRLLLRMISEAPISKHGVKSKRYASRTHAPGYLKRSIGMVSGGTDYPTVWVRPRIGKDGYDAWYWFLPMMIHKVGNRSTNKKTDYVRRAWSATKTQVEAEIEASINKELIRIIS